MLVWLFMELVSKLIMVSTTMTQASVHSTVRTQGFVAIIVNGGVPLPEKGKLFVWYTKFSISHFYPYWFKILHLQVMYSYASRNYRNVQLHLRSVPTKKRMLRNGAKCWLVNVCPVRRAVMMILWSWGLSNGARVWSIPFLEIWINKIWKKSLHKHEGN